MIVATFLRDSIDAMDKCEDRCSECGWIPGYPLTEGLCGDCGDCGNRYESESKVDELVKKALALPLKDREWLLEQLLLHEQKNKTPGPKG